METELFEPGTRVALPYEPRAYEPKRDSARVIFPGRIHMTPIDCNRFDFGHPGGGGYGFAVKLDNCVTATTDEMSSIEADAIQVPLVKHYASIMRQLFRYDGGLSIRVSLDPRMRQHFGLGSSAVLGCALVWAVNDLFGMPLSRDQCRGLVTRNFAEACRGQLARGLDTGVGTYVALHGGFVVVGGEANVVYADQIPDNCRVVLVDCKARRPHLDTPESADMLDWSRKLDAYYRYFKAYTILMDVIPALQQWDFPRLDKANWEFQFSGTHLSMLHGYEDGGVRLTSALHLLHNLGEGVVGMSSVGPAIYALTTNPTPYAALCEQEGFAFSVLSPCNVGATGTDSHSSNGTRAGVSPDTLGNTVR